MTDTPRARAPLLPRYRRPFSVSGVLDDTIQVFRQTWLRFIGLNLLAGILGLVVLALTAGVFFVIGGAGILAILAGFTQPGASPSPTQLRAVGGAVIGAGVAAVLLGTLVTLAWNAAASLMTDSVLHGERAGIRRAIGAGLRRGPALIAAAILYFVGLALAGGVSFAIVYALVSALRGWSTLVFLAALVALLVWAFNAIVRRAWLKWLIIVLTPFGLPTYFGVLWSLFVQAVALERAGPIRALQRSSAFVSDHWFRVAGVWLLMSFIVSLLQAIPGIIVGTVAAGVGGASAATPEGIGLLFNLSRIAGSYVGGIVFGSLPMCAATLTFVALRNQREGTDLAERLEALDATRPSGAETPLAPAAPAAP